MNVTTLLRKLEHTDIYRLVEYCRKYQEFKEEIHEAESILVAFNFDNTVLQTTLVYTEEGDSLAPSHIVFVLSSESSYGIDFLTRIVEQTDYTAG